jgi:hypothetical protein
LNMLVNLAPKEEILLVLINLRHFYFRVEKIVNIVAPQKKNEILNL